MSSDSALEGVSKAAAIAEQLCGMKGIATNAKAHSLLASLQHHLTEAKTQLANSIDSERSPAPRSKRLKPKELLYADGLYHILLDTP